MKYFSLLIIVSFLSSCSADHQLTSTDSNIKKRPNIIFMLADDIGWNEVGFNNDKKKYTPHIDQLKSESMSLTQFYVHAVCAPSRAAFLTGRYPFRTWSDWRSEDLGKPSYLEMLDLKLTKNEAGEETRRIHALDTDERTIAEALQETGYYTAITGKWGCGEWLPEHLPMGQGFMHQYGHYAWGIDYNNHTIPHNAPARYAVYDWHRNEKPIFEPGYSTDLIANEVVSLLSVQKTNHGDQPFFYYVPFNGVHGPLEETPRYGEELGKRYGAVKCLDDAVGRIMKALNQYNLDDNTIVVFTNDNGAIRDTMNSPYRGTKNTNYEGGVRVPCLIKWPGKTVAGSENNALVHITDFYSTFVKIAGGSLDQERPLDGYDLTEVLFGSEANLRKEVVFDVADCVRLPSIRSKDHKLVGEELYNLREDPYETSDIAILHPAIVKKLKIRLNDLANERPPMPKFDMLMTPALPWVYGQIENKDVPQWLIDHMVTIRSTQPTSWPNGTTPWPQAPKNGKIIYLGDGR